MGRMTRQHCYLALGFCCVLGLAMPHTVTAKEHKTLTQKADDSRQLSRQTEQEQLDKARQAANDTSQREQEVLKRQADGDWEVEQRDKAQKQFNERESREEKYLREAKEAAAKARKIPKPTK